MRGVPSKKALLTTEGTNWLINQLLWGLLPWLAAGQIVKIQQKGIGQQVPRTQHKGHMFSVAYSLYHHVFSELTVKSIGAWDLELFSNSYLNLQPAFWFLVSERSSRLETSALSLDHLSDLRHISCQLPWAASLVFCVILRNEKQKMQTWLNFRWLIWPLLQMLGSGFADWSTPFGR